MWEFMKTWPLETVKEMKVRIKNLRGLKGKGSRLGVNKG